MSTRDFLVEIGTEELPPLSLPELSSAFTEGVVAGLAAQGIQHGAVHSYATPRRLALLIHAVPEKQPPHLTLHRNQKWASFLVVPVKERP